LHGAFAPLALSLSLSRSRSLSLSSFSLSLSLSPIIACGRSFVQPIEPSSKDLKIAYRPMGIVCLPPVLLPNRRSFGNPRSERRRKEEEDHDDEDEKVQSHRDGSGKLTFVQLRRLHVVSEFGAWR
jgi:hypothetical protein